LDVIDIAMIPVTYEPMEGVLVVVAGPFRWIGTYGEMISSNLQGAESPQMDVVTLAKGREMSETFTREKEGRFTRDTLGDLDLEVLALPPGH
jgi:hypothetical protein